MSYSVNRRSSFYKFLKNSNSTTKKNRRNTLNSLITLQYPNSVPEAIKKRNRNFLKPARQPLEKISSNALEDATFSENQEIQEINSLHISKEQTLQRSSDTGNKEQISYHTFSKNETEQKIINNLTTKKRSKNFFKKINTLNMQQASQNKVSFTNGDKTEKIINKSDMTNINTDNNENTYSNTETNLINHLQTNLNAKKDSVTLNGEYPKRKNLRNNLNPSNKI